jgi:diguanylate cyclase (GGDEF)-like protein
MYLTIFLKYAFFLEKKIMNESRTDELTQINNRYALYDYLESIDNKTNLFLAIFDIDDFKMVNDTYGHVCGDYILKSIARITIETMSDEFVCRYGGEEFIVILKNEKKKNQVFQRLETLRKNIENYAFEFEGKKIHITITLGAAKYTKDINSLTSWIEVADAKLYDGKQTGKNKTIL